jgi:hypothetical protein
MRFGWLVGWFDGSYVGRQAVGCFVGRPVG